MKGIKIPNWIAKQIGSVNMNIFWNNNLDLDMEMVLFI